MHEKMKKMTSCHESMIDQLGMEEMPTGNPYTPLIAVIIISSLLAVIQAHTMGHLHFHSWMNIAMGYYLIFMSTMKFFDLPMFAFNYKQYDLFSKVVPVYAFAYPTIELLLGALFINNIAATASNIVMAVVMTSSFLGIIMVLKKGGVKPCSCMGPALNVPLGMVSLIECGSMIVMAIMNLMMTGHSM
ncbi:MAG: hypothetical protein P4L31_05310 [Candidatus Babeliales bacterium]|nr:hypothetical protein [Candidatus Babeliales bacterium]